jgi:hypothetical protein
MILIADQYINILETVINQGPLFAVLVAVIFYLIYKEKQYEKKIEAKDLKIEEKEKANSDADKETRQVLGVVSNTLTSIIEDLERQNNNTSTELARMLKIGTTELERTRDELHDALERQEETFKAEISRLKEFVDLKIK